MDKRRDTHYQSLGEELESFDADSGRHGIGHNHLCLLSARRPFADTHADTRVHDGQHDFDFNIGVWHTHIKRILDPFASGSESVELNGTVTVRKVWNGKAELEEIEADGPECGGSRYTTGASIGVAMNTMDIADAKAWLESADQACFEAKRQGRGRLQIVTPMGKGDQLPAR